MKNRYPSCSVRNTLTAEVLILIYFKYMYHTWNKTYIKLQIKLHLEEDKAERAAICDIPVPPGKTEGSRGRLINMAEALSWWRLLNLTEPETVIPGSLWRALGLLILITTSLVDPLPIPSSRLSSPFVVWRWLEHRVNHTTPHPPPPLQPNSCLLFSISKPDIHPKGDSVTFCFPKCFAGH